MLRTCLTVAAAGALALATAYAQTPPAPTAPAPGGPAMNQPAPPKAGGPAMNQPAPAKPTAGTDTKASFVTAQKPDQLLASKFRGTDVIGAQSEKIGSVSDILFEKNGTIVAYVVGVGGFLGIGSKDVALAPAAFQEVAGQNGAAPKLRLSMTKDELQQATAFEPYRPPAPARPVTGSPSRPTGQPTTPPARTQ